MKRFDVTQLQMLPLAQRKHKLRIEDIAVSLDSTVPEPSAPQAEQIERCAEHIRSARANARPVILTFGAHLIKNGLGPLAARLVEAGWITHLATNGAGSIHDWEFAFIGRSTEDVRTNVAAGCFGTWDETGRFTHLALAVGGANGYGYGYSIGKLIHDERLTVPEPERLRERMAANLSMNPPAGVPRHHCAEALAADADLLALIERWNVEPGRMEVPHPYRRFSLQYAAARCGVPFTVHPGIGYDIIYTHPMASGGAVGRAALRDFHTYAASIAELGGGVHIAIGSSVMAPMIFEKAMSMANNAALASGRSPVSGHYLAVVDIQNGGGWDWRGGEPPMDNPAYYLRFCKTFYRMGGELDYIELDNRVFLTALARRLLTS
jgi:hypothetical protein